jgi:hypothetical protein
MAFDRSRNDGTILKNPIFWDKAPIRFTMDVSNPRAIRRLHPVMEPQRLGGLLRLSSLGNLLRPLCTYQGADEVAADIVFDSEVWRSAIDRHDPGLEGTVNTDKVRTNLHYNKSAKTPGLQIADLAAGIVRQYHLHGNQRSAFMLLQANELIGLRCRKAWR